MSDRAPRCPFCGEPAPGATASGEQRALERKTSALAGKTVTSICDHAQVSQEAVDALAEDGVKLDLSLASLAAVDQYLDDSFGGGRAPGVERWAPTPEDRRLIAMLGSYLGEVLRLRIGGDWEDDPDRPGMPLYVRLRLPNGSAVLPLDRAYRRLKEGRSMGLEPFAADLREQIGDREVRPEDGMDWANHATDYIRNERFDVALQFLRRAVEVDSQLCEGWFCRGFVEEKLARPHDALQSYDRALQLSPSDDRAFLQHVKAQIQRLNADLGGYRHATGELRASGVQPPVPPPVDSSIDDASLDELREVVTDESSSESSVVRAINDTRAADADTAAPGARTENALRAASAAVQQADARHEAPTLQPEPSPLGLTDDDDTPVPAAMSAAPSALRLADDALPDLHSRDLFATPPHERSTLDPSALNVEDIQAKLRGNILEDPAGRPARDATGDVVEALSLAGAGRLEEAANLAAGALDAVRDAQPLLLIARTLNAAGRAPQALDAVRKALELDSAAPDAHRLHTSILLSHDLPEEALGVATGALARWPDAAWAWYLHGRALFAADRFDDAARSLERSLTLDPAQAEAWRLRGLSELECGRVEEARMGLRAYLALADIADGPAAKEARRQLGKLELAR